MDYIPANHENGHIALTLRSNHSLFQLTAAALIFHDSLKDDEEQKRRQTPPATIFDNLKPTSRDTVKHPIKLGDFMDPVWLSIVRLHFCKNPFLLFCGGW